ncbi:MAG: transcriptional regulator, partial [Magnetovibrio sp.]|nr:transcriptional regulator [Magnetovibrio sp.]
MNLAEVGNLVGDLARAQMLTALLDGRALTAGELAWCAGIMPQ